MAGGTFTPGSDKVRAGLYMNFKAKALAGITVAERGTVVLPLLLGWGEVRKFTAIRKESDAYDLLGYDINSTEMSAVRETLKGAKEVLVYRLSDGVKATVTVAPLTATAKYSGTRGNNVSIVITTDVVQPTKKLVRTLLSGKVVDEQLAVNVVDLKPNAWVVWSGTGAIVASAGVSLATGSTAAVINGDYTDFLAAAEVQIFNTIAFPVADPTLKTSFVSYIQRLRDDEGKKIQGVVANHVGDYEGIINVTNGVILAGGQALDAVGAVPYVAGITAGASYVQSNTYRVYEGAVDANPRIKHSEIMTKLGAGEFLFFFDGKNVKVEQDINSLYSYTQDKNKRFSKNRVIRVLDAINNDLLSTFSESYVGKIDNDEDGQFVLKSGVNMYFQTLEDAGAITNFDPLTDFIIDAVKSIGDVVIATVGVQPVDSMEKFYFTVEVK